MRVIQPISTRTANHTCWLQLSLGVSVSLLASLNVSMEKALATFWTQHVHLALTVHEHEFAWGEGCLAFGWGHIKRDTSALQAKTAVSSMHGMYLGVDACSSESQNCTELNKQHARNLHWGQCLLGHHHRHSSGPQSACL